MRRPPIFTPEFLASRTLEEIAAVLNSSYYDLVRAEARLLCKEVVSEETLQFIRRFAEYQR